MKTFTQFKATFSEGSLPRALGNGLHGNLRYAGLVEPLNLPKHVPKKTAKLPTPSAEAIEFLKIIKQEESDRGGAIRPDDIPGWRSPDDRAKLNRLLSQLEKAEMITSFKENQGGNGTVKKIRST